MLVPLFPVYLLHVPEIERIFAISTWAESGWEVRKATTSRNIPVSFI
jgi:hypothetical protein